MYHQSTHRGHCQLCGRLQKLPKGFLSKHGYTVARGFFSGVCHGAAHLPFEKSFALVVDEITRAEEALKTLQATMRTLRNGPVNADTKMWVYTYVESKHGAPSFRIWEPVTLNATLTIQDDGWRTMAYTYVQYDGKIVSDARNGFHGVSGYEMPTATCEEIRQRTVLQQNRKYADWLVPEEKSLDRYIAWQKKRITNWVEQPLLPIDAEDDDQAFVPTPAPY